MRVSWRKDIDNKKPGKRMLSGAGGAAAGGGASAATATLFHHFEGVAAAAAAQHLHAVGDERTTWLSPVAKPFSVYLLPF